MSKERLTVTVDPHLAQAANHQRLRALADAVAAYEREFGASGSEELAVQERTDRASARVVRGPAPRARKPSREPLARASQRHVEIVRADPRGMPSRRAQGSYRFFGCRTEGRRLLLA